MSDSTSARLDGLPPICFKCGLPAQAMIVNPGQMVVEFDHHGQKIFLHVSCWESILQKWIEGELNKRREGKSSKP